MYAVRFFALLNQMPLILSSTQATQFMRFSRMKPNYDFIRTEHRHWPISLNIAILILEHFSSYFHSRMSMNAMIGTGFKGIIALLIGNIMVLFAQQLTASHSSTALQMMKLCSMNFNDFFMQPH